jgi:8-oxo-dGTP pyrophosphatase MutT (NUDIX family)
MPLLRQLYPDIGLGGTGFMGLATLSIEEISQRLASVRDNVCPPEAPKMHPYPPELVSPSGDGPRPSAVLIPLLREDGQWRILFTRRTDHLADHSGQVAFPGGRSEPGDASPEDTALREAYEEIGLAPEKVRILGRTDSFITITNYCVTPVVGLIDWPFEIKLDLNEVSRVFTIPLSWLEDRRNYEILERKLPDPYPPVGVIYFEPYEEEILWGVSAQIMLNLLDILRG